MAENLTQRLPSTLGITWAAPTFDGGSVITDYLVNMAKSDEDFEAPPTAVTNKQFKAESLTAGVTYKFRIAARNSLGSSVYSDVLSLLCAYKPDTPSAPKTVLNSDKMIISWIEPKI